MSGKIAVMVKLIETHVNWEEFSIDSLPHDWEEMSEQRQWDYVQTCGEYKGNDSEFFEVDHVSEVNVND